MRHDPHRAVDRRRSERDAVHPDHGTPRSTGASGRRVPPVVERTLTVSRRRAETRASVNAAHATAAPRRSEAVRAVRNVSRAQTFAALGTPSTQNLAAVAGRHAGAETMRAGAVEFAGLKGAFHDVSGLSRRVVRRGPNKRRSRANAPRQLKGARRYRRTRPVTRRVVHERRGGVGSDHRGGGYCAGDAAVAACWRGCTPPPKHLGGFSTVWRLFDRQTPRKAARPGRRRTGRDGGRHNATRARTWGRVCAAALRKAAAPATVVPFDARCPDPVATGRAQHPESALERCLATR